MSRSEHAVDVAVAGGGIIGLAVAWAAAQRGLRVAVFERDRLGAGASGVAAGMLAPVSEVEYGEAGRRLLELGLRSAGMWPRFAQALADASGVDAGLRGCGTMLLARDADDARELERQLDLRRSLGLPVERLRGSEAREREPALAPSVRLALDVPDDHSVDPREVLRGLRIACEVSGVALHEGTEVSRVDLGPSGERVAGLTLADGTRVECERMVLALGAWSPAVIGLPAHATVPVRPVKGQIVRLRDPSGPGLLSTVLRHARGYLVPRDDGRYILGATVEERGYELSATAGGVYELLRDAYELVPGIAELEIEELSVGLRPGTPDNTPVLGTGTVEGLLWATGHHRNGILLTPLTAELLANELAPGNSTVERGRLALPRAELLAACSPARFAGAADRTAAGAELVS
jgi:glycine oxidase